MVSKKLMMGFIKNILMIVIAILIMNNCVSIRNNQIQFYDKLNHMSKKYIHDNSLAVNDIDLVQINKTTNVRGKTTNKQLYDQLKVLSDSLNFEYEVLFLPDSKLGDSIYGIINVSVAPLRERDSHASQMIDQVIMGNTIKILYETDDWYLCQTHYDYVGWITRSAVFKCTENFITHWKQEAKYRVNKLNTIIYSEPDILSMPVSDAVLNNRLFILDERTTEWHKLILPDGRTGFIYENEIELCNKNNQLKEQKDLIISNAISMKGIPYLWGGNSSKGNDCSGFTQTVFMATGIQIPRDARQQAEIGKLIQSNDLEAGDLLFFGNDKRITHVGISMGGFDFIHQGSKLEGKVDIHSFNPDSPIYNNYRKNTFLFAKRIISPPTH